MSSISIDGQERRSMDYTSWMRLCGRGTARRDLMRSSWFYSWSTGSLGSNFFTTVDLDTIHLHWCSISLFALMTRWYSWTCRGQTSIAFITLCHRFFTWVPSIFVSFIIMDDIFKGSCHDILSLNFLTAFSGIIGVLPLVILLTIAYGS